MKFGRLIRSAGENISPSQKSHKNANSSMLSTIAPNTPVRKLTLCARRCRTA